jgi:hypothetical protein
MATTSAILDVEATQALIQEHVSTGAIGALVRLRQSLLEKKHRAVSGEEDRRLFALVGEVLAGINVINDRKATSLLDTLRALLDSIEELLGFRQDPGAQRLEMADQQLDRLTGAHPAVQQAVERLEGKMFKVVVGEFSNHLLRLSYARRDLRADLQVEYDAREAERAAQRREEFERQKIDLAKKAKGLVARYWAGVFTSNAGAVQAAARELSRLPFVNHLDNFETDLKSIIETGERTAHEMRREAAVKKTAKKRKKQLV